MKLDSREFQCQLDAPRFADRPSGIRAFFSFVAGFDPHVSLHAAKRSDLQFEVFFYDTLSGDFAAQQIRLRVRVFPDHITCTHKVHARDRYWLKKARVDCSAKDAATKFEENIYGYHSMFSWEIFCNQPLQRRFSTLGDWAALFEGADDVCVTDKPLVAEPSRFFYQVAQIALHFDGRKDHGKYKASATLELKYGDSSYKKLLGVEFAWKHLEQDENFNAYHVRRMRHFYDALCRSQWADPSPDLARCQAERL